MTDALVTEYEWQGPASAAPTAPSCSRTAPAPTSTAPRSLAVADALAADEDPVAAVQLPVPQPRAATRPTGPRCSTPPTREAAAELAKRAKLPPERLVLGGRSMGGRYCSMVVGADDEPVPALGLLMLSYPLHAPGKPEKPRTEHFPGIRVPILFVSGTRDVAGRPGRRSPTPRRRSGGRPRSTGSTPPTTATGR